MTILHLVRKSAFETSDFEQCINTLTCGDKIVLLDDGCYNVQHPLITSLEDTVDNVMVVQAHAEARAIQGKETIQFISMSDLIALTFKHNSVITWQ